VSSNTSTNDTLSQRIGVALHALAFGHVDALGREHGQAAALDAKADDFDNHAIVTWLLDRGCGDWSREFAGREAEALEIRAKLAEAIARHVEEYRATFGV
jgi:hypothetical protein